MELRRCSHIHYIRAIKAGSIQKICNVDSRGQPSLMIKSLLDIYESEDSKRLGSIPPLSPQHMDTDTSNVCNRVDRTCLLEVGKERDTSTGDEDSDSDGNEKGSDSEDPNFEGVTLKQLRKRCKSKKRKLLHSLYLTPKQEYTDWMPEEDEVDLDEPISSWKSKNLKAKKKRAKKCSSQTPSPVKHEPVVIDKDSPGTGSRLPAPITSKVQASETSFNSEDSSVVCTEVMELCNKVSSDILPSSESEQDSMQQVSLSERKICALNEASYDHLEHTEFTCNPRFGEILADILKNALQHPQSLPAPVTSEIETLETEILEAGNTSFSAEDSSVVCAEAMELCKGESSDILLTAESEQAYVEQQSLTEQNVCVLGEVSYDNLEHIETTCNLHSSGGETLEDIVKETLQHSQNLPAHLISEREASETEGLKFRSTSFSAEDSSLFCTEVMELCKDKSNDMLPPPEFKQESVQQVSLSAQKISVLHEVSNGTLGHIDSTRAGETVNDVLEKAVRHSQALPAAEDFIENAVLYGICSDTILSSSYQGPDTALDNFCFEDVSIKEDSCKLEDIMNDNFLPNSEHNSHSSPSCNYGSGDCSFRISNPCASPDIVLLSTENDDPASEKSSVTSTDAPENLMDPDSSPVEESSTPEKPQGSASDSAEMGFPDRNHVSEAANEVVVQEMDKHLEHSHPPERLLSTRKAISPTSQEKLCKAMKSVELKEDTVFYICKEKLQFEEDTECKGSLVGQPGPDTKTAQVNSPPKGLKEIVRTNITTNPKQMTRIPKNGRKGSPPKGTRKGPNHCGSLPPSVRSCSDSAIAFSRRQMQDMESLAAKLMQELKSMKDIVEGSLNSEASPTTSLKYDTDEIKIAIKSATKAEETSRKWLSIMSRDCNRFCKLMSSNGKPENAPGNTIVRKERRKITFADEAGGMLCHIKVFEDDTPSLDSKTEHIE